MKNLYYYDFTVCSLGIAEDSGAITEIFFNDKKAAKKDRREYRLTETPLIMETRRQLDEYFSKKRRDFDLPLSLRGTGFQLSVWEALRAIPYGTTCSYLDVAAKIGSPKACRAVGMANNRNPVVIVVPCHRVIGKNKSLTGYGGGLELKKYLLELEKGVV